MSTLKQAIAASADLTCAMASKTTGQGRRSAAIDNSTNLYVDAYLFISITPGTITAPATVFVYVYGSHDGTNYYSGGSTDADYNTLAGDELLAYVIAITANTTARSGVGQIASAWKGAVLPRNWGCILSQTNCGTLSATEGNHLKKYAGISYTIA